MKGPERERRGQSNLELAGIYDSTKIPHQIEKFWASSTNKVNFQEYISRKMIELALEQHKEMIMSGVVTDKGPIPCKRIFGESSLEVKEIFSLKSENRRSRSAAHSTYSMVSFGGTKTDCCCL